MRTTDEDRRRQRSRTPPDPTRANARANVPATADPPPLARWAALSDPWLVHIPDTHADTNTVRDALDAKSLPDEVASRMDLVDLHPRVEGSTGDGPPAAGTAQ